MKISSASKKVLASALSAAMVVAFAPAVAFGAPVPTTDNCVYVKGSTPVDGTVASYTISSGGELVTWCYTEQLNGDSAATALQNALKDARDVTVTLHQDINGNITVAPVATNVTLDLNGHTITNEGDLFKNNATVTVDSGAKLTVKGGTITAVQGEGYSNKAVAFTSDGSSTWGQLAVKNGTFNGVVEADILSIDEGVFNGAVKDANGTLSIKNATIEASSSSADVTALKLAGALTVTGALTAKASAAGNDHRAIAIDGSVTTTGEKAALDASAETTGFMLNSAGGMSVSATGINGNLIVANKSAAKVTATAKDGDTKAQAVVQDFSGKADLTATVAGASDAAGAIAVGAKLAADRSSKVGYINGGKFTGLINSGGTANVNSDGKYILGGTFTANPKEYVDTTNYSVIDNGDSYTVYAKKATAGTVLYEGNAQFANWFVNGESQTTIAAAFNDVIDAIANDEAVANVTYAEGKTASDLKAAVAAGKVSYVVTVDKYNAKTATDAEKANYAAIEALAKGKKSAIKDGSAFTYSIAITNGEATLSKRVVYGYLTNLGTGDRSKARTIQLAGANGYQDVTKANIASNGYGIAIANNGVAADQEIAVDRAGDPTREISSTGMFAVYSLSLAEIGEGETPAPAPEKATQGIDVSKKSRTVKIGSKTKTAKALYFKMGASAETTLATAKKSGSSRITVSGDKVTLKKGTKKGTYTAKVSLKAAGSDEYLAAAKTITVKFVVKK